MKPESAQGAQGSALMPLEQAVERVAAAFETLPAETVALSEALGRVTAAPVRARRTQPPKAVSAMDGYALRARDVAEVPARLAVVGEIAAGTHLPRPLGPGEAARIFTGAPVPEEADCIVIQEVTEAEGDRVVVKERPEPGQFVRPAGLDFRAGQALIPEGRVLGPRDIGLAAAMNVVWLQVRRRPRVAILGTGDEVVMPGEAIGEDQIASSNGPALAAFLGAWGAQAVNLGIAADRADALVEAAERAAGCDLLVTTGGASVGKHDLIVSALGDEALGSRGLELDFWRIAMRPGKPLIFGRLGGIPLLGLPGNPVSTLVCALLFVGTAVDRLLGIDRGARRRRRMTLAGPLPENDRRQDYIRAEFSEYEGEAALLPFPRQDSSMLATLARSDALIVRPPFAPAAAPGETVEALILSPGYPAI